MRCVRLDETAPAALRDTEPLLDIGLDERHATPEMAAALEALLQEAFDSGRWRRGIHKPVNDAE